MNGVARSPGVGGPASGAPDLGRAAARGTVITLSAQGFRFVLQLGSMVVLARLLTPEDFGLVAMVTALLGVVDIVRDFGLSSAAIQSQTLSDPERTNLFWVNVLVGGVCTAVVVVGAPLVVLLYGEDRLLHVVLALSWVFLCSGASTQFRAELSRSLRFTALAVVDVAAQAVGIAAAVGAAVLGVGYWAIVGQQIAVAVTTLALSMIACRWRPGLPRRDVSIRRFLNFGGAVLGTQVIAYATRNVDNIAIGAVFGPQPLGLYSRAYQLLMVPLNQINAPLTRIALPVLSQVQRDDERYLRYLHKAQLVGCYLTATVLALCVGLAEPIVAVVFGSGWSQVAPLFAVLAVGGVFRAVAQISYWMFLSRGLTGTQLRMYAVTRPLTIGIMLAGLPWGPLGVAVGCSVAYLVDWLVQTWWVGRASGLDVRPLLLNATRTILVVSAPVAGLSYLGPALLGPAWGQLLLGTGAAAGYLVLVALVIPRVRKDVTEVLGFVRSAVSRRRPVTR